MAVKSQSVNPGAARLKRNAGALSVQCDRRWNDCQGSSIPCSDFRQPLPAVNTRRRDPNVIESPHSGVRMRTRRVCRWRDSGMVKRWMASALLATEKNFRKIMGYRDLWALDAILNGSKSAARREAVA